MTSIAPWCMICTAELGPNAIQRNALLGICSKTCYQKYRDNISRWNVVVGDPKKNFRRRRD